MSKSKLINPDNYDVSFITLWLDGEKKSELKGTMVLSDFLVLMEQGFAPDMKKEVSVIGKEYKEGKLITTMRLEKNESGPRISK